MTELEITEFGTIDIEQRHPQRRVTTMSQPESPTTLSTAPRSSTKNRTTPALQVQQVSVVVPVFNERDCVSALMCSLVDLDVQLNGQCRLEFILVDDGSSDGTAEMLRDATEERSNFQLVRHEKNRGIAAAIHTGIRHARHEVVVSIDADGSYDAMLIEEMLPLLTPEVALVTASPYHPLGAVENVPWWRLWLSQRASALYRLVMRTKLACYTSCFRVYRRSKILDLEPENAGFVGVAELLWKVDRQGLQIVEHPAVLRTRIAGYSKMRIFRSSLRHLHLITQVARDRIGQRLSATSEK